MKLFREKEGLFCHHGFISHYVQMKLVFISSVLVMDWDIYIPLRSDETRLHRNPDHGRQRIYIPLRSDETGSWEGESGRGKAFISHYVQMKPTLEVKSVRGGQIYIPLRSDETLANRQRINEVYAHLYPTTFRWNPLFLRLINPI